MKLPGINYKTRVHSLGRESLAGAMAASQAKTRAVMAAIQVPGAVVMEALEKYQVRQTELGLESAALGMAEAENTFAKKYGEQVQYSAEELPSEGFAELKTHRTTLGEDGEVISVPRKIPAYEVRPELYKSFMDKQIQIHAEQIPIGQARDEWVNDQRIALEKNYGRHLAHAIQEQVKVAQDIRTAKYKLAIDEGRYGVAKEIVYSMEITPEEKEVFLREVNKEEEIGGYKMAHANLDVEAMQDGIDYLLREDYREIGFLNETERNTTVAYLRRGITAAQAGERAQVAVNKGILQKDIKYIKKAFDNGDYVDPQLLSGLIARTRNHEDLIDEEYELTLMQSAQNSLAAMTADGIRFEEQQEYIQRSLASAESPVDLTHALLASKMHEKSVALYKKDTPTWLSKYGNIEMTPISPDNIAKTGSLRVEQLRVAEQTFGSVSGVLNNAEKGAFVDAIRNNGIAANITLAQNIYAGLGEDAGAFIEDLSDSGAGMNFLVAGKLVTEGNVVGAKLVFEGARIAEADPKYTSGYYNDLDRHFSDKLTPVTGLDDNEFGAYKQAMINAYHSIAKKDGVASGVFNNKAAKDAFNIVMGHKLHDFEGYVMQLPSGMSGEDVDNFFTFTHPSYIDMHWTPANGWTGRKVWSGITDGRLQLQKFSDNKYLLWDTQREQPIQEKYLTVQGKTDRRPILFDFNRDSISWAQYKIRHPDDKRLMPQRPEDWRQRVQRHAAEVERRMQEYRESR